MTLEMPMRRTWRDSALWPLAPGPAAGPRPLFPSYGSQPLSPAPVPSPCITIEPRTLPALLPKQPEQPDEQSNRAAE